jgi:hypothetical protein
MGGYSETKTPCRAPHPNLALFARLGCRFFNYFQPNSLSPSVSGRNNPALSRFIEVSADIMPSNDLQSNPSARLALWIFGSIGVALLTAALVAGLWYFLRGRRDKRTPETPQNTTLQRPAWPKHSHLCRVALPFSPSISRLDPRAHHNPCRAHRAPRSDPRVKLRLQARRCLLSSTALTPKRPRAG